MKQIIEKTETQKKQEMIQDIATNIKSLAESTRALLGGKLSRKAIVMLLASSSRQAQGNVESVLRALEDMDKDWLKR